MVKMIQDLASKIQLVLQEHAGRGIAFTGADTTTF